MTPLCAAALPILTVTGTVLPAAASAGTVTFNCNSPGKDPAGTAVTTGEAAFPSIVTVAAAAVSTPLAAGSVELLAGLVTPKPVKYKTTMGVFRSNAGLLPELIV